MKRKGLCKMICFILCGTLLSGAFPPVFARGDMPRAAGEAGYAASAAETGEVVESGMISAESETVTAEADAVTEANVTAEADAAGTLGSQVSAQVGDALRAVSYYENETVAELLAPSRFSYIEVSNKRREIAERKGINFLETTDEEAEAELVKDNLYLMSYGEAFARAQQEIDGIVTRLVDRADTSGAGSDPKQYYVDKMTDNKEKFLIGLAYLYRLYDFDMGDHNIKDVLLYAPETYGKNPDVIDWLIRIGGAGGDLLKVANNTRVFGAYNQLFTPVTASPSLAAFLETSREKFLPAKTLDEWFLEEAGAYIVERDASAEETTCALYSRLWSESALQGYILPLLSVSPDSVYVVANPATITFGIVDCYVDRRLREADPQAYEQKLEAFHALIETAADRQNSYVEVWKRIARPEKRSLLSTNRIVIDSLRIYSGPTTDLKAEWSPKIGENVAPGVREFIVPMGLYVDYTFVDGEAAGAGIRMYVSKALTENGLSTYTHEMVHLLVKDLILNGYGIRDGMSAEVYTRGMFETYDDYAAGAAPVLTLNFVYDKSGEDKRDCNASPLRFQTAQDLQAYMSGVMDVLYTLDLAEAESVLAKDAAAKQRWFHKLLQPVDTGSRQNVGTDLTHRIDSVRELTVEEAETLTSIEDLIDNNILASRYEVDGLNTVGTLASNGYYKVPLYTANYAAVENDAGVSGDCMIRRQAYELLAAYGFSAGMVPYLSNQYQEAAEAEGALFSDTYILGKIFDGRYASMNAFKKAMFQKRIDRKEELKPVVITWNGEETGVEGYDTLLALMDEAVEQDLVNVQPTYPGSNMNTIRAHQTQVELLKAEIFRAYLKLTDDFARSVYATDPEPTASPVPTAGPEETASPTPTADPGTTASPAPTADPGTTASPVPTAGPEETASPMPTADPGTTASPAPTAGPETSASPTPAADPEETASPTPAADPEEAASPTPTADPGQETKPAPTAAAENPAHAVSPAPTVSPGGGDGLQELTQVDGEWISRRQPGTKIAKVIQKKGAVKVKWKKRKSAAGYQLQYAQDKTFKKAAKKKTIGKRSVTSATIQKRKTGKSYYIRIRTFTYAQLAGRRTRVYSKWSKAKRVKIKQVVV